jgi:hypothetical protein
VKLSAKKREEAAAAETAAKSRANTVDITELDEERAGELFFALLNGKEVEETIETRRGAFVIKYPQQKDLLRIARIEAFLRGGVAAASFDAAMNFELRKCAFLDVVVTDGPAWFTKKKSRDADFSWRDIPDAKFADEVFASAAAFRERVQAILDKDTEDGQCGADGEVSGNIPDDVASGLFQGVSTARD